MSSSIAAKQQTEEDKSVIFREADDPKYVKIRHKLEHKMDVGDNLLSLIQGEKVEVQQKGSKIVSLNKLRKEYGITEVATTRLLQAMQQDPNIIASKKSSTSPVVLTYVPAEEKEKLGESAFIYRTADKHYPRVKEKLKGTSVKLALLYAVMDTLARYTADTSWIRLSCVSIGYDAGVNVDDVYDALIELQDRELLVADRVLFFEPDAKKKFEQGYDIGEYKPLKWVAVRLTLTEEDYQQACKDLTDKKELILSSNRKAVDKRVVILESEFHKRLAKENIKDEGLPPGVIANLKNNRFMKKVNTPPGSISTEEEKEQIRAEILAKDIKADIIERIGAGQKSCEEESPKNIKDFIASQMKMEVQQMDAAHEEFAALSSELLVRVYTSAQQMHLEQLEKKMRDFFADAASKETSMRNAIEEQREIIEKQKREIAKNEEFRKNYVRSAQDAFSIMSGTLCQTIAMAFASEGFKRRDPAFMGRVQGDIMATISKAVAAASQYESQSVPDEIKEEGNTVLCN